MEELCFIRKWLIASNEFKEEVIRLNNWIDYLFNKDDKYITKLIKDSIKASKYMDEIGFRYLGKYLNGVEEFLRGENRKSSVKEDVMTSLNLNKLIYR